MGAHVPGPADFPDRQGGVRVTQPPPSSAEAAPAAGPGEPPEPEGLGRRLPARADPHRAAHAGHEDRPGRDQRRARGQPPAGAGGADRVGQRRSRRRGAPARRVRRPARARRHRRPLPHLRTGGGAGGEPRRDVVDRRPARRAAPGARVVPRRHRRRCAGDLEPRVPQAHQPGRRFAPPGVGARAALAQPAGAVLRVRAGVGRGVGSSPRPDPRCTSSSATPTRRNGSWSTT